MRKQDMNLIAEERERLLSFIGYGNPQAPIWFLGMEEGTGGNTDLAAIEANIRTRAQHFKLVEDLVESHLQFDYDIPAQRKFTQVWLWMAKLVRGLDGESDWPNTEKAKSYVRDHLGRKDGKTLLVELLPLPSPGINYWPYEMWWATRDSYISDVLPRRITILQELIMKHRPRVIFAYGSQYHRYYKQIFGSSSWKRLPAKKNIEFSDLGEPIMVTLPFFGNGGLSTYDAQLVLNKIHETWDRAK